MRVLISIISVFSYPYQKFVLNTDEEEMNLLFIILVSYLVLQVIQLIVFVLVPCEEHLF